MWRFLDDRVLFIPGAPLGFEFIPILLDDYQYIGTVLTVPTPSIEYQGFDDWLQYFPMEGELSLVRDVLQRAQEDPAYHAHIQGISLAESVDLLRAYYRKAGYEDALAKNYTLPNDVQVTASISLRHALWCEKDKHFLSINRGQERAYGMISPPIRGSHDVRILQQALRMNIIMGIEVLPGDEKYIDLLLEQEILSPFAVSQMIRFRWEKYGWSLKKDGEDYTKKFFS